LFVFSQYLGALLLAATFISLGLAASSWVKSSIGSFLLAASIGFAFILVGLDVVVLALPWPFSQIAAEASILTHMHSVARGVLDLRDLAYFVFVSLLFLFLAKIKLEARKAQEDKKLALRQNIILALILILGIGFNVLWQIYPLRIDLTKGRLFTVSKGTKQTLKKLPDKVKITLYASRSLPGTIAPTLKQVNDLLKDYQRLSKNLTVEYKYPDVDAEAAKEAADKGIKEVTFNKIGASKFEMQNGYLGLAISFKDKEETIPFINRTDDLEYQLTKRIRKLAAKKEKIIGLANYDFSGQYQIFQQTLETEFKVKTVDLEKKETATDSAGLIIIDNGESEEATAAANLKEFLNQGKSALLLTKGVTINPQTLQVEKSKSKFLEVLKDFGINVNKDLVYDLELNVPVSMGQGNIRYLVPYPFWLKALPAEGKLPILANINSVLLIWPSSINLDKKEGFDYLKILETGLNAGRIDKDFALSPQQIKSLPKPKKQKILLGSMAQNNKIKLAVLADFNLLNDQFVKNNPQNLSLATGLVDFLVQEKDLASIPKKSFGQAVFRFNSARQAVIVQYLNILTPSVLMIVWAIFWLSRRKRLTLRKYSL